jgi:ribosome-associated toxin RatA of RatAB toxin-antitoxin module
MRLLLFLASALALSAPPLAIPASPAEEQALLAREAVVRRAAAGAEHIAMIDVLAPPPLVLDAVLDLGARVGEVPGLRSAKVYERGPGHIAAEWQVGFLGYTVAFSTRYDYDRAAGWTTWSLDPARKSDLQRAEGSYQAVPTAQGSRLIYRARTEPSAAVPEAIQQRISDESARQMLRGMRDRAERAAGR